jgi:uncharacterized protein (DUF58 family)
MNLSREGKRFILATLLTALAAFNTGNNLIYLIFSMMFSILVISVVVLKMNMKGLTLRVSPDYPVFAKVPAVFEIAVTNKKRSLPSYSVKVSLPESLAGESYFPRISAQSESSQTVPVVYKRRGVYGFGDFSLSSSFPFIFLTQQIVCTIREKVIVYPEIREVDDSLSELIKEGDALSYSGMRRGEEFSSLREFRYGDDRRTIHWKSSAKTTRLMVRENAAEEPKKLTVILDNLMPPDDRVFETAVSLAASLADRFLREGFYVRLFTCRKVVPFGSGSHHLYKVLDILAEIKGHHSWECPLSAEAGTEGLLILILCSEGSPLQRFVSLSDKVIYAAAL